MTESRGLIVECCQTVSMGETQAVFHKLCTALDQVPRILGGGVELLYDSCIIEPLCQDNHSYDISMDDIDELRAILINMGVFPENASIRDVRIFVTEKVVVKDPNPKDLNTSATVVSAVSILGNLNMNPEQYSVISDLSSSVLTRGFGYSLAVISHGCDDLCMVTDGHIYYPSTFGYPVVNHSKVLSPSYREIGELDMILRGYNEEIRCRGDRHQFCRGDLDLVEMITVMLNGI